MKKEYMNPETRVVMLSVKRPMLNVASPTYVIPKSETEEIESADDII